MPSPKYTPHQFAHEYRNEIIDTIHLVEQYCQHNRWTIHHQEKLFKNLFSYMYKQSDTTVLSYDQ